MSISDVNDLTGDNTTSLASEYKEGRDDILLPATTGVFYVIPLRQPHETAISKDDWEGLIRVLKDSVYKVTSQDVTLSEDMQTFGFNGANKAKAFTGIERTDQITFGVNEQSGNFCSKKFKGWVNSIRNEHTGLSTVIPYTAPNISADFAVFYTKPVLPDDISTLTTGQLMTQIVDECFIYKHISPMNKPRSTINVGDKESSNAIKFDITMTYREVIDAFVEYDRGNVSLLTDSLDKLLESLQDNYSSLASIS